jgi:hypothetical protein
VQALDAALSAAGALLSLAEPTNKLRELGGRVRDLFAAGSPERDRVRAVVDDQYVGALADAVRAV